MWCDNCLLLFPLRSGAMLLGILMAIYQAGGAVFLFLYGSFFFFHSMEQNIYGAYAAIQALISIVASIGFSMRSYITSSSLVCSYPFVVILGAVRAGVIAWSLVYYKANIVWECDNGGKQWVDPSTVSTTITATTTNSTLPTVICTTGVDNFSALFTLGLCIDFVLMCYLYFLIWRFRVKLAKGEYIENIYWWSLISFCSILSPSTSYFYLYFIL